MPFELDRWTDADYAERAQPESLPELMDGDCSYEDYLGCVKSLEQINTLSLGYRPTLDFLTRVCCSRRAEAPLHIVDVGFGGGGLLRSVAVWARKRGVPVILTGVDLSPHAARAAQQLSPSQMQIQWVTANIFSWSPELPVDVVLSSLFTHHLDDASIVRFVQWCETSARLGWSINDLYRSRTPVGTFRVAARLLRWHRFTLHDGPVSFRRAFREQDWQRYLREAAIPQGAAQVKKWFPARLCVERIC